MVKKLSILILFFLCLGNVFSDTFTTTNGHFILLTNSPGHFTFVTANHPIGGGGLGNTGILAGLVFYMPMDDATGTWHDHSTNNWTMTTSNELNQMFTVATGKVGQAFLNLANETAYFTVIGIGPTLSNSPAISYSVWIYGNVSGVGQIIGNAEGSVNRDALVVQNGPNNCGIYSAGAHPPPLAPPRRTPARPRQRPRVPGSSWIDAWNPPSLHD